MIKRNLHVLHLRQCTLSHCTVLSYLKHIKVFRQSIFIISIDLPWMSLLLVQCLQRKDARALTRIHIHAPIPNQKQFMTPYPFCGTPIVSQPHCMLLIYEQQLSWNKSSDAYTLLNEIRRTCYYGNDKISHTLYIGIGTRDFLRN